MTIYYNSKSNAFYDSSINAVPKDSVEITTEIYTELLEKQSQGLIIQPKNNYPIAVEYAPTEDEIKLTNESKQQQLINEANQKIAVLQDIVAFDMQESNEDEQLKLWKKYRILLTRIDINLLNIVWPPEPK